MASRKLFHKFLAILGILVLILISLAPIIPLLAPQPYVFPPADEAVVTEPTASEVESTVTE